MTPFARLAARAVVLEGRNVDTDQIIPARFLRRPRSAGYETFLFADVPAMRAVVMGAGVVFAGENFGCGSSREGAVYALVDAGVRCVVAPSFGDIFAGNAGKNGLLLLTLGDGETALMRAAVGSGGEVVVDLPAQRIAGPGGAVLEFEIEPFRKRMLLEGLDDIGMTLAHGEALEAWRQRDAVVRPWALPC